MIRHWRQIPTNELQTIVNEHATNKIEAEQTLATRDAEIKQLRQQRDGLRTAARELLARMDSSPERFLLTAAIAASEDK
jgi:hypothetical protein